MKKCTKCQEIKPEIEFYRRLRGKDGLFSACKKCYIKQKAAYQKTALGKETIKRTHKKHPETHTKWHKDNPERRKAYYRAYYEANKNKVEKRLGYIIRAGIRYALRGNPKRAKTFDILGYTIDELKVHLEARFQPGMSWENYGQWHIDHIIPISFFEYKSAQDTEFKMCWRLENLQPLWARANAEKAAKLKKQFQPMLKLAVA